MADISQTNVVDEMKRRWTEGLIESVKKNCRQFGLFPDNLIEFVKLYGLVGGAEHEVFLRSLNDRSLVDLDNQVTAEVERRKAEYRAAR